jgi:poly(beta-D-mannuronate) lyase
MSADGKNRAAWKTTDPVLHTMEYTAAVTQLPVKKPHVVCGQIHDADAYLMLVRLEGKKLFLARNGAEDVLLDAAYPLGGRFTVKIESGSGRIKVWYNGAQKLDWAVAREGCYFKVGCYVQSNPARGDRPEAVAETVVYRLEVRTTPPSAAPL